MSNFLGCYLSIYLFFEDRLIYYHLGTILLGPYATIAIILALVILGQAMSGWFVGICLGGHQGKFCQSRCCAHWRCWIGCKFGGKVGIDLRFLNFLGMNPL